MDAKLLLVKSITLLYRESLIANNENSADLVKTVLETIKIQESGLTLSKASDILTALKITALEMCENPPDHEYEKSELIQRLRMNCDNDDSLYNSFMQSLDPDMSESSLKRTILNIRKSLHNHFRDNTVRSIVSKASFTLNNQRESIKDMKSWIQDFIAQLEPFQTGVNTKDPAILDDVEIHDVEKLKTVFSQINEEDNGDSCFRTGWQGRSCPAGHRHADAGWLCPVSLAQGGGADAGYPGRFPDQPGQLYRRSLRPLARCRGLCAQAAFRAGVAGAGTQPPAAEPDAQGLAEPESRAGKNGGRAHAQDSGAVR